MNECRASKWECECESASISLSITHSHFCFHRKSRSNNGLIESIIVISHTYNCWRFHWDERGMEGEREGTWTKERRRNRTEFEWITYKHRPYTWCTLVLLTSCFVRLHRIQSSRHSFIKTISINRIMPAWMFMSLLNVIMIIDHNSHLPSLTLLLLVIFVVDWMCVLLVLVLCYAVREWAFS